MNGWLISPHLDVHVSENHRETRNNAKWRLRRKNMKRNSDRRLIIVLGCFWWFGSGSFSIVHLFIHHELASRAFKIRSEFGSRQNHRRHNLDPIFCKKDLPEQCNPLQFSAPNNAALTQNTKTRSEVLLQKEKWRLHINKPQTEIEKPTADRSPNRLSRSPPNSSLGTASNPLPVVVLQESL